MQSTAPPMMFSGVWLAEFERLVVSRKFDVGWPVVEEEQQQVPLASADLASVSMQKSVTVQRLTTQTRAAAI